MRFDKGDSVDVQELRRRFAALHDELRNQGMNPLESVGILAALVSEPERRQTLGSLSLPGSRIADDLLAEEKLDGGSLAVAFQEFISSQARYGLGQYLTPLPVAQLIARVTARRSPEGLALDPFGGVGLLLDVLGDEAPNLELLAIEINPTVAAVATALAQLSSHPMKILLQDSVIAWCSGALPVADAIVTNPPFGAQVTTANLQMLTEAGASEALLRLPSIPAELLGLELALSTLRSSGFLAIVLPQSVLTNASWSAYRRSIFSRLDAIGIVSLPEETFGPFRGVAKACVLFGIKAPTELPQTIPFFRSRSVGYDESGRPTAPTDLPEIAEAIEGSPSAVATVEGSGSVVFPPSIAGGARPRAGVRLGDISEVFRGRNPSRDSYVEEGPWLLKVGGLTGSFIPWKRGKRNRVPESFFKKNAAVHLRIGDICLTAAAHRPRYVGLKVDLVDELPPDGAMPSAELIVIRPRPDAPLEPLDLLFYLRSDAGYTQLQDLVRGSTAHLYPRDLQQILVPRMASSPHWQEAKDLFWAAASAYRQYRALENALYVLRGGDVLLTLEDD